MTTEEFITLNADADVRSLALRHAGRTDIDLPYALDQIAGRRTARTKLPAWAATDGMIYPPHIALEQCSSQQTALYKADTVSRLLSRLSQLSRPTLLDLTGGFGVDFSYLAPLFARAVYVERQSRLCDISRHNFSRLGITRAEIICADSEQILASADPVTMIYADPARRDAAGARTFAISDCTPDMLALKDMLLDKACFTMIKLSPMLDWRKAAADFGGSVGEVHIVSAGNECKELLLVLSRRYTRLEKVYCVNDGQIISFDPALPSLPVPPSPPSPPSPLTPLTPPFHLYEPNSSIMKAGCFTLLAGRYGISQVSPMSHLYISPAALPDFPGRGFIINTVTSMNKRELKAALAGTDRANISVRNFPLSADALRRRLKLKDGGSTYIFGTTAEDGRHLLMIGEKER